MDLINVLAKIELEYNNECQEYRKTSEELKKLETMKNSANYANQIAKLKLKLLAFSKPQKCKKELFKIAFNRNPKTVAMETLLFLGVIVGTLAIGNFLSLVLASFMALVLGSIFWANKAKWQWIFQTFHNIIQTEYYEDLTNQLENVKKEANELDNAIKQHYALLQELINKINEHYNTYEEVGNLNQLKNPLIPFKEEDKGRRRVLKK